MLALFKTEYSIGKSLITLRDDSEPNGPDSAFNICTENGLEEIFLVEDGLSGFLRAYEGAKKHKLNLRFGLRISCVQNLESEDDRFHKVVLFAKNGAGCEKLIKIFSEAATKLGKKYPTIDLKYLKSQWSDDLHLVIPYYDSFLFKNHLTISEFIPDLSFTEPVFFKEKNGLPFEPIIDAAIEGYCKNYEVMDAKSIYYKNRADFDAWQTFKLICNRKGFGNPSLEAPNMEHCHSNEFCFEAWLENK